MNQYTLPFKPTDRVLELGGGDNAIFPENVDIRPGPKISLVADLNEPLPIESESYDGVFSQFLMEHLRLPKLRGFLSEVHRILKPGGIFVAITANLLEQCRVIVERDEKGQMSDDLIHMVFGGSPDYPENYHHASLTPNYAFKLFKEVGFNQVKIFQHPVAMQIWGGHSTDMIIEATKGKVIIKRSL